MKLPRTLAPIALGAAASVQPFTAIGQTNIALEEIVVTAQKREQSVQDVPVAISVMGTEAIENLDIKDFNDVARTSPSLTVEQEQSPDTGVIRMRGIGTSAVSIGAEASVAVVVDEVPLMMSAQAFGNLMDIERIEVLRGPQGTLFGKNASAGVVNIVTQSPSEEFIAKIGGRVTSDDETKIEASLSGPLSDQFSYRLSGYTLDRDGYIENLAGGDDLNGEEAHGLRAKFEWLLSDNLDATVIVDHAARESSSAPVWLAADPEVAGERISPGQDNEQVRLDTPDHFESDQNLAVVKFNYDLGEISVTSITSYQDYRLESQLDVDLSDIAIEDAFPDFLQDTFNPLGFTGPQSVQDSLYDAQSVTQELRLQSASGGAFEYMAGVFYSNVEIEREFDRKPIVFVLNKWDGEASTESMALFGQGSLSLSENTFIDLGLRVNREEISVDFTNYYANGFSPEIPESYSGTDSQTAATGKLAIRHFLNGGPMVFASVSTGYKGQAYDVSSSFDQSTADNPVGEETSISYELGIKGLTENRRLSYELVAFLTDFEDYQAQGARTDESGAPVFKLNNVGELRTQGLEADITFKVTSGLTVGANIALVDATIESFTDAPCYDNQTAELGCNFGAGVGGADVQDLSGEDLNNAPDLKYNLHAYWESQLQSLPVNVFAQANYQWQDEVHYDLYGNPVNEEDAYGVANISFGVIESDEKYSVTVFVNNLFDEQFSLGYYDYSSRFNGATAIAKQWSRQSRRYGGIKFDYRF